MTEEQFYAIYVKFNDVIIRLNEKLLDHKQKFPKSDISAQIELLEDLRFFKDKLHQQWHLLLSLENQHGKWIGERSRLLDKITHLENENKQLKNNIK